MVEEIIVILLIMVKVTLVDSVDEQVETSQVLVLLEDGLVDVLLVTGHHMVYVVVEVVLLIVELTNRMIKEVTQVQGQ